jgi:hypothetical protein
MAARHTIDTCIAVIADLPTGRLHGCDRDLPGIFHRDGNVGFIAGCRNKAAFNCERPDARKDIPAILRIGDNCLINENLQEQIVDINALARRFAHNCDLAGQRVCPAHAIDLQRIWGTHDPKQECIALYRISWQIAL